MVAAKVSLGPKPTPENIKNVSGLPNKPVPSPPILSPKAILNPINTQRRLITPSATKLYSIVEITFLYLTMPA